MGVLNSTENRCIYVHSFQLGHSVHGNYGDNVEEMDWSVGEVVSSLEKENLLENTMVYFTSDHGPHLEETMDTGEYCGGWRGLYKGGTEMISNAINTGFVQSRSQGLSRLYINISGYSRIKKSCLIAFKLQLK